MSWLWTLPPVFLVAMAAVLHPLFSRRGHAPLPVGLEGDPQADLAHHTEQLLHQLKTLKLGEMDGMDERGDRVLQTALEHELAEALARMDQHPASPPEKNTGATALPPHRPSRTDRVAGIALFALTALLAGLIYHDMGTHHTMAPAVATDAPDPQAIHRLVQRLAERLAHEPDRLDGWMHLARSWTKLGNTDAARQAYTHILSRQSDHVDATVGLAVLHIQSGLAHPIQQGIDALTHILEKQPDHTEALWFLGAAVAHRGDVARATKLWRHLLTLLPYEDGARDMVQNALQTIQP